MVFRHQIELKDLNDFCSFINDCLKAGREVIVKRENDDKHYFTFEIYDDYREWGAECYSCDIQECSGGHPEWHIKDDAINVMKSQQCDLIIATQLYTYIKEGLTDEN